MKKREPRFHGEVSEKSHKNMSSIRGKDTSIEIKLRKALWHKGYRYRKNVKDLPGRPDIALAKYKIAIFCDSEFFHGKDWDLLDRLIDDVCYGLLTEYDETILRAKYADYKERFR